MRGDRVRHPALGLFGGGAGAPGAVTLNGQPIHSKRTIQLQAGDRLVLETPGGGGYGDPAQRLEAARDEDRKNGYTG
jgi:N-methylhydantoinase B/oxoprolinase/acetone carboxylase alpha subunit